MSLSNMDFVLIWYLDGDHGLLVQACSAIWTKQKVSVTVYGPIDVFLCEFKLKIKIQYIAIIFITNCIFKDILKEVNIVT